MTTTRKTLLSFPVLSETIPVQKKNEKEVRFLSVIDYNRFFKTTTFENKIECDETHSSLLALIVEQLKMDEGSVKKTDNLQIKQFISEPKNYFVLRYFNDVMQYGLVSNQPIAINTVVGIYCGYLFLNMFEKSDESRVYDASAFRAVSINNIKYSGTIRALDYGNLTRFAPHLPCPSENIPSLILTANMTLSCTIYNDIPLVYYKTTRDIKKGDVMGIDYGSGYWNAKPFSPVYLVEHEQNKKIYSFRFNKETVSAKSTALSCPTSVITNFYQY